MNLIRVAEAVREPASVLTVGTFDGIHVGHRAIIDYLVHRAAETGGPATLVTFDPHPREVVGSGPVALLTTVSERAHMCAELGIDRFVVIPFTSKFSELSPEAFVSELLLAKIGMKVMVVGHDHGFGRGRSGNEEMLRRLSERHAFEIDVIPARILDRHAVSSSEIRRLLIEEGDVARAAKFLGAPFRLSGRVVEGVGRGKVLGFPTANIEQLDDHKLIPMNGVYSVRVFLGEDRPAETGMMNIGCRPTFDNGDKVLEVHILDFEKDLYGQRIQIEFVSRIRSEKKFESGEALVRQLYLDRERCIASFAKMP